MSTPQEEPDVVRSGSAEALMQGARAGSSEALGRLLDTCRAYLLLVAAGEVGADLRAKGGASDLVQETFLEAQGQFVRFHGDTEEELLAWLRRILLNNVANFTRRYRQTAKRQLGREVRLSLNGSSSELGIEHVPDGGPSPSWQAMAEEQAETIEQAVERLPEDYRQVVRLVHREHRSFSEAAQAMNRSADAARRLWSRAIEQLAHELEAGHERR